MHSCFKSLQIGDRNFYTLQESDIVLLKPEWKRLQKEQLYKGGRKEEAADEALHVSAEWLKKASKGKKMLECAPFEI